MPSTTTYSFGDIVLVSFPYTDQSGQKQRPAAVVSSAAYHRARPDLILIAVTSQMKPAPRFGEAMVKDWQHAGLLKPSAIKPVIFTAEKGLIRKTLGAFNPGDQQTLRHVLQSILG